MLKIGSLKLRSILILAPMSGISDLPFRTLNRRFGCKLAFTEMINVRSLGHKSKKTQQLLSTNLQDSPLGIQLLGGEANYLLRGLEIIEKYKFDILDFNAACPARKVTRRGEGASLLKDPKKLKKLLTVIVKNTKLPVTVKIRIGWDKNDHRIVDTALMCQDAGVDALFVHGRTKVQEYGGKIDYDAIKNIKKKLRIPVIGSGDIFSGELAKKMLDETGCDGLLVARGAFGNPWIFKEIEYFLNKGVYLGRPDCNKIIDVMKEHFNACIDFYGQKIAPTIFRKFFAWYTKGFRGVRSLREKSNTAKTADSMLNIINECINCCRR